MTAQVHEKIRYQGKRLSLATCPGFPEDHPRISKVSEAELQRITEEKGMGIILSTACWRGYNGSWSIRRGKLYLTKLEGRYRLEGEEALFADWFTGALHIPQGDILDYIHMGFDTVYEAELILTLEQGVVTDTRVVPAGHRIRENDLIDHDDESSV